VKTNIEYITVNMEMHFGQSSTLHGWYSFCTLTPLFCSANQKVTLICYENPQVNNREYGNVFWVLIIQIMRVGVIIFL